MCFEKNLWNFKQILKILFKILKVLKSFESFKENVNKNKEKLNENYNFLLLSSLIAGWGLGCFPSFAYFPGFQGGKLPPSPPATPLELTYHTVCMRKLYPNLRRPNQDGYCSVDLLVFFERNIELWQFWLTWYY